MKTLEQLLKSKVFSLLVIILMCATFCLSAVTCGLVAADFGKKGQVAAATLLTWNAPSYEDVDQSEKVTLKPLIVKDTEGNEYRASIAVLDPEGDPVAVIGDSFKASIVGQYTVTYTVTFNGVSESKSSTFYAVDPDDSNDQGEPGGNDQGDPDDGGPSPTTEYKAGVMTSIGGGASDDPFTVSGNTVSVKKASSEGDYKGVKWELSNWSNAKAPKMSIEISNDTGAELKAKYKLVTDKGDCYSYPDFELAAGESSAWVTVFSENNDFSTKGATSITAIEMYLITTATSGTLSIELTFPGSNAGGNTGDPDDGGSSSTTEYKAGVMTSIGGGASDDPFTVSGNTVSVKKASSEGDYKGVKWELSNWSNAKAPKMSIEISNDTGAELKAKYKLVTDKGDCYSYPDFELAAGESSAWVTVFSENNDFSTKGATSITAIEMYLITTATSGTLSIELTFPGSNAGGNNAGGNTGDDSGSSGGSTSAGQFIGAFSAPYYADLFTINGNQISFDYNGDGGSASYNMVKADITGYDSSYKYLTVRIENTGDTEIGVEVRFNFNPDGQNYFFQTKVGAGKTVFKGNNIDWLLTQGNRTGFKDVEIIINSGEADYKTDAKTGSFKITFEWSTELGTEVTG